MKIPIDPAIFAPLIAFLLKVWTRLVRYEVYGDWQMIKQLNEAKQPLILALWHGEIFPVTSYGYTVFTKVVTFVSQSKDGEIIARVLKRLGHKTVRGSSTRGGVKALLQAKRIMEREHRVAVFTIDGPKGPRHKSKDGIIFLAHRAGAKIIPLRAYPTSKKVFDKSWDKFVVPYPFSRCRICIGEPMEVVAEKLDDATLARERGRLEATMHALKPDSFKG